MERVDAHLAQMHRGEKLDFSRCQTFNLDAYIGLSADDPRSYHWFMRQHLFSGVNIPLRNTHLPNGMARDLAAEARRYEQLIRRARRTHRVQRAALRVDVAHPAKSARPDDVAPERADVRRRS
jgi:6-phosphogluconolactonase/glucosamine-6-phosphate isomerase/deaminase